MLKAGFVKLDRSITGWRWYTNANTARVFIHLILIANYEDKEFESIVIRRGQAVTSYSKLADALGLTVRAVRTAIGHLKATGELTSKAFNKFQIITIVNYDQYQDNRQSEQQSDDSQMSVKRQSSDNNERKIKKDKERKEAAAAHTVLTDEIGTPPEGFSTWEDYHDWLRE